MADLVEIVLALRNVPRFVEEAGRAAKAIKGVGDESEESGKKAGIGWKGVAKWAGGAAAVYGVTRFMQSAVDSTEDLTKSTLQLQRATGMSTETASEWISVTKERGIGARQLQTAMGRLNRTVEAARAGTATEAKTVADLRKQIDAVAAAGGKDAPKQLDKLSRAILRAQTAGEKSRKVLAQLGLPLDTLAKGDTQATLEAVADSIAKIENPAQRSTAMLTLFGRGGLALLPILMKGREGIHELLAEQKSYGNYLSGKSIKDTQELIKQERELSSAFRGAKVQLGTALMPVLVQVGKLLVTLARLTRPLTKHTQLFTAAVVALAAAFVVYKVAMIAATVAQTVFNFELGITAIYIGIAVVAFVALAAAAYLLYKHFDDVKRGARWLWQEIKKGAGIIKDALMDAFDWAKRNWPLLLGILTGPFGLAVGLIIKHFDAIKRVALGLINTVKAAVQELIRWVLDLPAKIGQTLKKVPGYSLIAKAAGGAKGVVNALGNVVPGVQAGGTIRAAGTAVVGERGPELVVLPRAAQVVPLQADGVHAGYDRPLVIEVPVMLDRREIARATAQVTADRMARR